MDSSVGFARRASLHKFVLNRKAPSSFRGLFPINIYIHIQVSPYSSASERERRRREALARSSPDNTSTINFYVGGGGEDDSWFGGDVSGVVW